MPTPFESRIIERLFKRLSKNGLNAALEYGFAVCGCNPRITNAVLSSAPEPLKTMLTASFAARDSIRKKNREALAEQLNKINQEKNIAIDKLISEFESARRIGQAAVFVAALTMVERDLCKATKKEVSAAMDMRRNCIRSTKVKEILLCSDTELKRWSEDGRLPVMFRRRMKSSAAVTLEVRHWDAGLVEEASQQINQWREDDALERRRKKRVN